jgi:hypothetical protein
MPDAVMTDEARDPGDVALLSMVGVVLETKDISDLSEELHGRLPRQDIAIFVPWRAMRVRAARGLVAQSVHAYKTQCQGNSGFTCGSRDEPVRCSPRLQNQWFGRGESTA